MRDAAMLPERHHVTDAGAERLAVGLEKAGKPNEAWMVRALARERFEWCARAKAAEKMLMERARA